MPKLFSLWFFSNRAIFKFIIMAVAVGRLFDFVRTCDDGQYQYNDTNMVPRKTKSKSKTLTCGINAFKYNTIVTRCLTFVQLRVPPSPPDIARQLDLYSSKLGGRSKSRLHEGSIALQIIQSLVSGLLILKYFALDLRHAYYYWYFGQYHVLILTGALIRGTCIVPATWVPCVRHVCII